MATYQEIYTLDTLAKKNTMSCISVGVFKGLDDTDALQVINMTCHTLSR